MCYNFEISLVYLRQISLQVMLLPGNINVKLQCCYGNFPTVKKAAFIFPVVPEFFTAANSYFQHRFQI